MFHSENNCYAGENSMHLEPYLTIKDLDFGVDSRETVRTCRGQALAFIKRILNSDASLTTESRSTDLIGYI